jgi:hypothetical protein
MKKKKRDKFIQPFKDGQFNGSSPIDEIPTIRTKPMTGKDHSVTVEFLGIDPLVMSVEVIFKKENDQCVVYINDLHGDVFGWDEFKEKMTQFLSL